MSYVNDPIGDLLTRMRNAQNARKATCSAPHSKMKLQLCELLKKEGWIADVKVTGDAPKQDIEVTFDPEKQLLLSRVSKPGRRVYAKSEELKPILRGYGIAVLTTSEGIMTDADARRKKIGGEVLCTIA
jgi:small subunit ribosomal protein S8